MSEEQAIWGIPTIIIVVAVAIILIIIFGVIFNAKVGSTMIKFVGSVLMSASQYTGVFSGLMKNAVSGLADLVNF